MGAEVSMLHPISRTHVTASATIPKANYIRQIIREQEILFKRMMRILSGPRVAENSFKQKRGSDENSTVISKKQKIFEKQEKTSQQNREKKSNQDR